MLLKIQGNYLRWNKCLDNKESIKMLVSTNCPCRLCKVYVDGVGFAN